MSQHFAYLLLGLGSGGVYAALAMALVVTYRSSGVVNFATGAISLYTATTYAYLREGQFVVPIPGLPAKVDLPWNSLAFVPAAALALATAAVLGVVLYLVVFRPLRRAAAVAKAVASIGVMIVIQGLLGLRLGTDPLTTPAVLPDATWHVFGQAVRGDRVWFALAITAVAALVTLLNRFTRFGLVTRAAAETERGALVTGLSPERIALANWALSAVVAGIAGILISPIVPIVPVAYTLFIVPTLAAGLAGGFTLLIPAVAAGLAIGMVQSETLNLQSTYDWLPQAGLPELVSLVLIVVVLVVRGRPLPSRGTLVLKTLGGAPRPRSILPSTLISVPIGAGILLLTTGSYRLAVITTFIFGVIALSLVVVSGYAGQISFAQLALAGVGAFALARLAGQWSVPFPIAPLLASGVAALVGVVVGLPALRIRGLPVAVVTLALAVTLQAFWFNNPDFNGGFNGAPISTPSLFGVKFSVGVMSNRLAFGFLCLVVLSLVAVGVAVLRRSRLGAAMAAVKANERSAAAAGIDVARTKIAAFAIAAYIAGLGGCLLAYLQQSAIPSTFDSITGLGLFATVFLAGITSVCGGVLAGAIASGGVLYVVLDRNLDLGNWYTVLAGALLVVNVILKPEGLAGDLHRLVAWLRSRRRAPVRPEETGEADLRPAAVPRLVAAPAADANQVVLSVRGLTVRYRGIVAVDDVSFDVEAGTIVGLIGPNGAGKTTLLDAVSGYVASAGTVTFEQLDLQGLRPHQRVRAGLGRTFQGIELYEDLTVEENVSVGEEAARHGGDHLQVGRGDLEALFDALHLAGVRQRPVRELSAGYRQLVSVARALAGRPRVVLLDEPASGLDSDETQWLGERLKAARDQGITIVMIDHDMSLVLGICDVVHVLDLGALIASGPPAEIRDDPRVAEAYLGAVPDQVVAS
ncbi:branched-chain amino acid ABC transporter permease/ATP-binding protein [Parafrankia discariae]|uniref:branched-chain amino acid ABC transporter permease/ATP-binding protein n=1 Tax=Parafrankia discariae TaxID=365528 RepID=UPI000477B53D|nr:branched-chain amino acid ABC transporter permease/ATP-binding protein [Parafrankia discariae]